MYEGTYRPTRGTPFGEAFHKADREIHGQATDEEIDWLEDHPIMWLRALSWLERIIQSHTGMQRMRLARFSPLPGESATATYLRERRSLKRKQETRHHLQELIYKTREEVKSMIDDDAVTTLMTVGDLMELMVQIREMAKQDDFEGIDKSCHGVIGKIQRKVKERDAAE